MDVPLEYVFTLDLHGHSFSHTQTLIKAYIPRVKSVYNMISF